MKKCSRCGKEKEDSEFRVRNKKRQSLQSNCIECNKAYHKDHYRKNKAEYLRKNQNYRALNAKILQSYKENLSCVFCGESSACCLDFHHKDPEDKLREISVIARSAPWSTVEEEIKKCVVLCSNCHRKIHAGILTLY